jgi:predicted AAA+ superfamily ATPase
VTAPLPRRAFEALITLSVRVYAQAIEATVGHLRLHSGRHEIDLIVQRPDGNIVAIEVKLARTINDHDVRHLKWIANELGEQVLDTIIITTGDEAYRRRDGIAVVPAALLGA